MANRYQKYLTQSVRNEIAKNVVKNAKKSFASRATTALSKVAIPAAIVNETYNTGKSIKDFVSGVKDYNKESKDWVKQSMYNSNDIISLLKKRRKSNT